MIRYGVAAVLAFFLWCVWMSAEPAKAETVRISAVGDVMLGSEGRWAKTDPGNLLDAVKPFLTGRDINFFNQEGTLTTEAVSVKKGAKGRVYAFKSPPEYAGHLARTGFNMASLANNHSFDYGPQGLKDTREALEKQGMVTSHHSGTIARRAIRGIRVAMAAFWIYDGDPHNLNNLDRAREITSSLAKENDLVVISFHGGAEGADQVHVPGKMETYMGEHRGDVRAFARAVVDSGADLVLGHGPHAPRGLEMYRDRLIAYSLGNFCTVGFGLDGPLGLAPLLQVDLDGQGRVVSGRLASFIQRSHAGPVVDADNRAARLMYDLGRTDFGPANGLEPDGSIRRAP